MTRLISIFACLLALTVQAADNTTIWQGKSAGLKIHWTEADITATKRGKILFSARALAREEFEADFLDEENVCEYRRDFTLLSLVGSFASFKELEYTHCQGMPHPSVETRFTAIDLAHADKVVKLTDFFAESDILNALLNDSIIKKALAQTDLKTPTLQALYDALEWVEIPFKNCGYRLPEDFLTQFAFHHLNGNQVAIRLSLPSYDCQSTNIQLGFYLPIGTAHRAAFKGALLGRAGFLMGRRISGGRFTSISFSTASASEF
jgi:hypothetical protein